MGGGTLNGYLVLACFLGRDIPCGLFPTRDEAAMHAYSIPWNLEGVVEPNNQPDDPDMGCWMAIVPFVSGRPGEWEFVRDYEQEQAVPLGPRTRAMEAYARALRDKAEADEPDLFSGETK